MKIVIIKYNAGNIYSVQCALKRIGVDAVITDDFDEIRNADKVIFPGVGEASSAMAHIREKGLDKLIKELTQPVLGICVGLQLMCQHSEEGNVDCLGIFNARVKRFDNSCNVEDKVPHIGWNTIKRTKENLLFDNSIDNSYVYYVHSYYAETCEHTIAATNYIVDFSAVLHRNNFYATQFHPEKSGSVGEAILKRFIEL